MDDRALMTLMDGQTRLKEEELRHFLCQFLSTEWQKRSDQRNERAVIFLFTSQLISELISIIITAVDKIK